MDFTATNCYYALIILECPSLSHPAVSIRFFVIDNFFVDIYIFRFRTRSFELNWNSYTFFLYNIFLISCDHPVPMGLKIVLDIPLFYILSLVVWKQFTTIPCQHDEIKGVRSYYFISSNSFFCRIFVQSFCNILRYQSSNHSVKVLFSWHDNNHHRLKSWNAWKTFFGLNELYRHRIDFSYSLIDRRKKERCRVSNNNDWISDPFLQHRQMVTSMYTLLMKCLFDSY